MSKFLLSLVMGASAVLATNTSCANCTSTDGVDPTPDPVDNSTHVMVAKIAIQFTLKNNTSVAGMDAVDDYAAPAAVSTCSALTDANTKSVCLMAYGLEDAMRAGDTTAVLSITGVEAGDETTSRRSLTETNARRLTATATTATFKTSTTFASQAALAKGAAFVASDGAAAAIGATLTAMQSELGFGTITVKGVKGISASGYDTFAAAAAAGAEDSDSADDGTTAGAATTFLSASAAVLLAAMAF